MKKFLISMLICMGANSVFAQSEVVLTEDSIAVMELSDTEIISQNEEKTVLDNDSASVQIEVLQQKLKKMKSKNVFRWIGSILMLPASVFVGGGMLVAGGIVGSKAAATIGLSIGVGGVVGGILLFASAIRNQNRIKELSDTIKLMKQQVKATNEALL